MKTSTHRTEAELIASQEIKNFKDFIFQTGQSIDALRDGVVSLSIQNEKVRSQSESNLKTILIEFENLKEWISTSIKDISQRLGDAETKVSASLEDFHKLKQEFTNHYLPREEFLHVIDPLENSLCALELDVDLQVSAFNNNIRNLKENFKAGIEVVRKDLTPIPPLVDPISRQIDERMAAWKVDLQGLVTEIALLKKAVSYDEKKFENVYTLIERLKEGR